MRNSRRWLVASCAVAAVTVAMPAMAQKAPARAAADAEKDNSTVIEQVVVTAERRATSVQDTPLAITAFTDKARENLGIATIQDLSQFSPGLSYNAAADRPTIRGVGRQNNSHGLNSPVANYIDGVYTSSVQDTSRRPMFIDRVEILRGPQGALSGKGSSAGAINTFTKRPRKSFEAEIGGYVNNYDRYGLEGTVTGPITDSLRYRFNLARYSQDKGFFTNAEDGHTEGDRFGNRFLFDVMLAGELGEKTEFFLKGSTVSYYESLHDGGTYAPVISANANGVVNGGVCVPTPFTNGALVPNAAYGYFGTGGPGSVAGTPCGTTGTFNNNAVIAGAGIKQNPVYLGGDLRSYINNYYSDLHLEGYYNLELDTTHHFNTFDMRYIVGRSRYAYEQSSDADGTAVNTVGLTPLFAGGPSRVVDPNGVNIYREEPSWYSNELTFASTWDKKWQYILGFYQFNQLTKQPTASLIYRGFAELNNPLDPITFAPVQPNARPFNAQYGKQTTDQNTWATFSQIDYKFNDKWKISAGLRYNSDREKAHEQARLISNAFVGGANGMNSTFTAFAPIALDVSNTTIPGFALVNPTTPIEPGYRLIDVSSLGTVAPGAVTATCPGGLYRNITNVVACSTFKALLAPGVVTIPIVNPVTGERERELAGKWGALTGSLGINYTPNTDTLFYFRFARGYRPGGFGSTTAGFLPLNPYTDKETIDSYETGTKFTLWSKLQLDISLFRYNYKNIQAGLTRFERCIDPTDLSTCSPTAVTVNLPTAINQGVEVEGQWFVTPDLQLVLSYGYLDAHLDNGKLGAGFEDSTDPAAILPTANRLQAVTCKAAASTATCGNVGVNGNPAGTGNALDTITQLPRYTQDLSGKFLPQAPKNKVALNANYTFHLAPGNLTASVSYIWRDKAYSDLFNDSMNVVPAYSLTNTRLIFRQKDDKYQVIVYASNVFDQETFESGGTTRRQATTGQLANLPPHSVVVGNSVNAQQEIYYRTYGLVLPRVFGIEFLKKFR